MDVLADIRVAARGLLRSKGFAFAGSITLALGVAATTTIFSVVYGVLLRPLPYQDAGRLVVIQGEKDFSSGPRLMNYSPEELEDFSSAATAFSSIAVSNTSSLTYQFDSGIEPIGGATVSGRFFETVGAKARLGRAFGDDSEPVIVISDRFWRKAFGADPAVLGRAVRIVDRANIARTYTITGVMPPEFQYPRRQTDVWRSLAFVRAMGDDNIRNRNRGGAEFLARLRDGVTIEAARADAARANDVLKSQFANSRIDMRSKVTALPAYVSGTVGPSLWILLGAVTLVLLVACTNVASLILARQSVRAREISVRMALGAPRVRLVAYMLAESSIIAIAGAILGVAMSFGLVRLLQYLAPAQLPRLDAVAVDGPVLLFAMSAAALAAIVAGFGPAVLATRTDAVLAMRSGSKGAGSGTRRLRSVLVVIEIAASIVLLVGAALLSRSLAAMLRTNLGVNTENVMTAQLDLGLGRAVAGPRQLQMLDDLRQRVAAIPSVQTAGYGSALPPALEVLRMSFILTNPDNTATESHIVTTVPASPEYFSTLQIPLVSGRLFTASDSDGAPAVGIVNREAARRFFGNHDAIGRTLPFESGAITIVGVVENVKYTGIGSPNDGVVYRPFAQQPFRLAVLIARTTDDPARITNQMRTVIRSYDPAINVGAVQPLTTWVSDSVAQPRFRTLLLSAIAMITLLLAMVGLYAVIAYSTSQRTSEIGVRVAIGAQRADVIRLVLSEGARLAVIGIVVGLAGSYWATRLLSSFLYQVTTTDPGAFAGAAIALFLVALLATYLPARRAARIDPMTALRTE